jgi:hypothetical protein
MERTSRNSILKDEVSARRVAENISANLATCCADFRLPDSLLPFDLSASFTIYRAYQFLYN